MINFYQVWKEDKDSTVKAVSTKTNRCRICGKSVGGLKRHVEDAHGTGTWASYVSAEQAEIKEQHDKFLEKLNA